MRRRTAYIYMGTIVHEESLLNNVIHNRADFKSRLYKALVEEPERMDLCEKCESIYHDINVLKYERLENDRALYEISREEMRKGSVVLLSETKQIYDMIY